MKDSKKGQSRVRVWPIAFALGFLAVVSVVIVACSSTPGKSSSGTATVSTQLSDPATCEAPSGPYSHVYVTITDVQANVSSTASSTDSGWVDLTPSLPKAPKQIDLLGQANNQCFLATLGDAQQLQAGSYQQIRLILADNTAGASISSNACGNAANCVVLASDNSVHTLQLSSEAKTGIKIPSGQIASGSFTIAAGQTKDLDIDFSTCDKALHDEEEAYRKELAAAQNAETGGRGIVADWYAFTLSFKGVFLEGLEVAFIVVTFGNNQGNVPLAALGAAAAVLAVAGVGVAVRAPLARVPENTMKFAVGTMLTSFGVFWSAEGTGASWPGSDAALLGLVPATALLALGYTAVLRRSNRPVLAVTSAAAVDGGAR